ncbi:acetoin utilization AcuB family protein [Calidifontibacillus erzurumensis]|uniref:CBS domain-containing protein n=1 Tax=Calidifontibacillus erzurumensis TaxID=2741433 RepID=A0A8J8GF68_9BACI|nr:acetoin utilization AcuB family protein [Calidifontibacillus erzurumensis]NSL51318.1 CBS domain-containing protein [Calidifontibacillus erzurumensis]
MIIEEIMNRKVFTMKPHETIEKAIELMHKNRIRHIPIVDENDHVIGIVTDRDIRDASPSIFHYEEHLEDLQKPIASIMTENVITGHPLDFVEEVCTMFYEHNIGCLPITSEGKLVGIVTETDMLHTLVKLMGADQPSSLIEVRVDNKLGQLSEVSKIFSENKINIISVLVYPDKNDNSSKILLFRIQTMNPTKVIGKLKERGYTVLWPNLPGVTS